MVVFTGVSRSGKSSLAFGTLYAERQHAISDVERATSQMDGSGISRDPKSQATEVRVPVQIRCRDLITPDRARYVQKLAAGTEGLTFKATTAAGG